MAVVMLLLLLLYDLYLMGCVAEGESQARQRRRRGVLKERG